ncbi:cytochrome-c peroxidase [Leeuwenhoekiella aestuarii]|uniref:cytochrome-c peroxidase n=1 Tax=Leeuwenhoekiella aestuarii TaxID=2249426 RepID=UPI0013758BF6|nr:cytochrome c peroxidase [Leeuwenhoekiella aestuarii]
MKETVANQLETLEDELDSLQIVIQKFRKGILTEAFLRKQLSNTRNAYKQVESYVTYYFPEHEKAYINGAPIPHLDPYPVGQADTAGVTDYLNSQPLDDLDGGYFMDGGAKVLEPIGLQRLDELIYSDEVDSYREKLSRLIEVLQTKFEVLKEALLSRKYYHDYEVIEFSRLELVRITTKGITGFDTPGSLNGLQESYYAMQGVQELLKPLIVKASIERQIDVLDLFEQAKVFLLENNDFETFDRFEFIRSYINPLYKGLLDIQRELGIESTARLRNETPSWNAYSENIFGKDFLNPYNYTLLTREKDNQQLQALGKDLFFDTSLSQRGNISCASCHQPELAYTDGKMKSLAGVPNLTVKRNAPTLINAIFANRFFYDLRSYGIEDQLEQVIEEHLEYDTSFEEIVSKLNSDKSYKQSFNQIFKTDTITRYQFTSALISFLISLKSFDSPFDKYIREEEELDASVKAGFNLFMGKANCATCHYAPTFSGLVPPLFCENESEVLGVLAKPGDSIVDSDQGRIKNGIKNEDKYIFEKSFKTMTVRNAALTAPYFHNGSYETLAEVLDFYNEGGAAGMGLEAQIPHQTLSSTKLNLTQKEMEQLITFIESLTDVPKSERKDQ